jgi:polar amino acid transport system ATP-binding protein
MSAVPAIAGTGLTMRFGPATVLDGVDIAVARGEVVCILGPSGSGKSTLLRCLSFLTPPTAGAVHVGGEQIGMEARADGSLVPASAARLRRQRSRIGMVFQSFNLWPHLTALGNVTEGLVQVRGATRAEARSQGIEMLDSVGLADKLDAYPARLSGGQQQRVAIARALAMKPEILLFDEPTSALDPELVGEVLAVMEVLAERHTTMIVVTHEIAFAAAAADRVVFMDEGRIVEEAPAVRFFAAPGEERSWRFLERTIGRYLGLSRPQRPQVRDPGT